MSHSVSENDIIQMYRYRQEKMAADRKRWDILSAVRRGHYRALFPSHFKRQDVTVVANFIKRSWIMFARLTGKVPDIRVAPLTLSDPSRRRADTQEKIAFNYNRIWRARRRFRIMADFYVGFGAVGAGVLPDPLIRSPRLMVEDPRNCFPGATWDAPTLSSLSEVSQDTFTQDFGSVLEDMIILKRLSGRQLHRLYPTRILETDNIPDSDGHMFDVLHYFDSEEWVVVLLSSARTLSRTAHGLDHCPMRFETAFAPDRAAGESMFEQQIGLNLAFMRVLNQKLAMNDQVAIPWLFTQGLVDVDHAARRIKGMSSDARAEMIAPPTMLEATRDMAVIQESLRQMNFETEATQGQVSGSNVTGQGISALNKPTVDAVQSFFEDFADLLAPIYADALLLDVNEWPDERKELAGWGRGEEFFANYTPSKDIGKKIGAISVDYGPGLGGYEGHLELLQDLGAESMSVETVMEWNRHIRSVSTERRRIFINDMRKMLRTQGLIGQLAVPLDWMAAWIKAVEEGEDPEQWMVDNPPPQASTTPEGVPPVAPGAAGDLGGLDGGGGGGSPERVFAPSLSSLLAG